MHPLFPYWEPISIPLFGGIAIHSFGVLVAVGFVLGARWARRKAERDGLDPTVIDRLVTWIIVGVFVGGHLGDALFYDPKEYFAHPIKFLEIWQGLSSFGGFIACIGLGIWFFRREKAEVRRKNRLRAKKGEPLLPPVNAWGYADAIVYGLTIGWMFGRLGCFSVHDHPGTPTHFWLGVYGMCKGYTPGTGPACHSMGLYEAIWSGVMAILFRLLDKRPRFPGFYSALMLVSYTPLRFYLDFYRTVDTRYYGLTPAQYFSVLFFFFGVWILVRQRHEAPVRPVAARGAAMEEGAVTG